MLLGRLRIRGKLALLVAIPLLAVLGLTVPIVANRVQLANRAADTVHAVQVANQVGLLLQNLEEERVLSVAYMLNLTGRTEFQDQTAKVDDQASDVRLRFGKDLPSGTPKALDAVHGLNPLRAQVLAHQTSPVAAVAGYTAAITGIIDGLRLLDGIDLGTLGGRQMLALDSVLRLNASINKGAAILTYSAGTTSPQGLVEFSSNIIDTTTVSTRFTTYATPVQSTLYAQVNAVLATRLGPDFLTTVQTNPIVALAHLDAATAFAATRAVIRAGRFVEETVAVDITREVNAQEQSQVRIAYLAVAVLLVLLLLMILLSAAVARAVALPLTHLTRSAERVAVVAEDELVRVADDDAEAAQVVRLDTVDTTGRDEIGELARAFERVQGTAAGLVERQVASRRNVAQMFGHVGRRTQNLVGRQLALIDRLERAETDPTRLSDLYRLDHVSNRLRRSAGSLVVLSGGSSGDDHVAPLSLGDVVRLALGEIEDYTRVVVEVPASLAIVPAAVSDMILMMAELMENATVFSPPHTSVSVRAGTTAQGACLFVADNGIGLPDERLAEENARLTRRERLDLAPSEVLGLFVVGRLARRHGVRVMLAHTPGGGVTAQVDLPGRLLTRPPAGSAMMLDNDAPPRGGGPVIAGNRPTNGNRAVGRVSALALDSVPAVFNITTLKETLETGPSWNAFVLTSEPSEPQPATSIQAAPVQAAPVQAAPAQAAPAQAAPAQAAPAQAAPAQAAPAPAAPIEVAPVDATPVEAAPTLSMASAPAWPAPMDAAPSVRSVALPARRVPGATLDTSVPSRAAQRVEQPVTDPEAVRASMEMFEFGVARALGETGGQDPEGTPR